MERGAVGQGLTVSKHLIPPTLPTGSRNMPLVVSGSDPGHERGPYLCDLGVGKSLACLLQQKKSQECNAPSTLTSPDPRQHAPPDGWSWLSAVLLPPHLEQTLLGLLCPRGSSRDASPDSHLGCPGGVRRVPPVTQPSVP